MRALFRNWAVAATICIATASPAVAEDAAPMAWQGVITSQIQAFRDHDAPAAFSHAGLAFQASFPDAETFFVVIMGSGYAPIMESRSHRFGGFTQVGEGSVLQQVRFVGNDQSLYDAVYRLAKEAGEWRVQGVQLQLPAGIAI